MTITISAMRSEFLGKADSTPKTQPCFEKEVSLYQVMRTAGKPPTVVDSKNSLL